MIEFLAAITREAGERVLMESRKIKAKKEGGGNWVSQADLASEIFLKKTIHQAYSLHKILTDPGYKIYAEETNNEIINPEKERHLWVIDPLDGTTNFIFDLPLFVVSVAYVEKGVVRSGAIYDPFRRELFWASKGKGAFLNNKRILVKKSKNFSGALIDIGSPYKWENFKKTYPLGMVFHQQGARIVNLGTSSLASVYVACGRLSLFLEAGLKPWDLAAAKIIVEEAGGVMDFFSKSSNLFNIDKVIVGNKQLVRKAKKLIATDEKSVS